MWWLGPSEGTSVPMAAPMTAVLGPASPTMRIAPAQEKTAVL
ncbi:hypothetical protein LAH08_03002 [Micromonospora noduli]|uniref:Uncharacterized protein n=1 Tax=Micromonospora noduli TaxID=709876 RepID=A0A328N208_9ACTN|nr:hypothetical protein LAH08_03002 [Micromonospora noduli]